jgi:hypothetical protein
MVQESPFATYPFPESLRYVHYYVGQGSIEGNTELTYYSKNVYY